MSNFSSKHLNTILTLILFLLIGAFCFSLFKNIQYPLLWNDEADTAMFATRILEFGYPKIHDRKNTLYQAQLLNNRLIINEKYDAMIEHDWLPYYFAAPFIYLIRAFNISSLYSSTAILRIPFALIGFLGVVIMSITVLRLFKGRPSSLIFLVLFFSFELLSVSLGLHLREMRYYSLVLFILAGFFYFYLKYHFLHQMKYWPYTTGMIVLGLLMLVTYRPVFFIIIIFAFLHNFLIFCLNLASLKSQITFKQELKNLSLEVFKRSLPFLILLLLSLPYLNFFRVLDFFTEQQKYYSFSLSIYLTHLIRPIIYFWQYEFLPLVLFVKGFSLWLWWQQRERRLDKKTGEKIYSSLILSLFFILYLVYSARIPYFMFIRYVIPLQPILVIILLLDLFINLKLIKSFSNLEKSRNYTFFLITISIFLFLTTIYTNMKIYKGHIYELFHQYQGPLDLIIPYLSSHYKNPQNLIIATNYEEQVYMFYLGSKVTMGYVGNNLKEDSKVQPDIIIFRNGWGSNPQVFNYFLQKAKYKTLTFPIFNYPLNNIPEFDFVFPHLFQTKFTENENDKLKIFVRENL